MIRLNKAEGEETMDAGVAFEGCSSTVVVKNGEPMMSSKAIVDVLNSLKGAGETDTLHKNVLRDVDKMLNDLGVLKTEPGVFIKYFESGLNAGCVEEMFLNEELSICFVSGKNAKVRMAVVKGFQANRAGEKTKLPNFNDPVAAARAWADAKEAEQYAIQRAVAAEAVLDKFTNTDGLTCLQAALKQIGVRPNLGIRWLQDKGVLTKKLLPTAATNALVHGPQYFSIKTVYDRNGTARQQTLVTQAGSVWLNGLTWPPELRVS
jgi:phage antirepressor YoqD-like protein